MLNVLAPEEARELIRKEFSGNVKTEQVPLDKAFGRVLAEDICAREYVPDFDRSTVDGYAVRASDTFGCSESLPALLTRAGEVLMGQKPSVSVNAGSCAAIPTGGALPEGADSVVMVEYTEDYGDGTIGILKSAVPGNNLIFRGDDVYPGKQVIAAGKRLGAGDIGALAAMGITEVSAACRLKAGIISTGDELVAADTVPGPGQIRDVNSNMLSAILEGAGAEPVCFGIIKDKDELLRDCLKKAVKECDIVLISGGSSVGEKDAAVRVIASEGGILFHGIAMKPGKPTILGKVNGKPVFGLPGHPAAAYFTARIFVREALAALSGELLDFRPATAVLDENISANHGRAEYVSVQLYEKEGILTAHPVRSKSGLICSLASADGWFCIDKDCEGLPEGSIIKVYSEKRM